MTSAAYRPVTRCPTLRRSPHEHAILTAIGGGATADDLLRCPKWTVRDVAATLQRYGIVADEHGKLTRKRTVDDLLLLAQHSSSPFVRFTAAQAADRMRELDAALTGEVIEAERGQHHDAVQDWCQWLAGALTEARAELRRLRARKPKGST